MTANDENISVHAIEIGRRLGCSLAAKLHAVGVSPEDATIASAYAAFDLASGFTGSRISGIEWMRSALDAIERQIIAETRR